MIAITVNILVQMLSNFITLSCHQCPLVKPPVHPSIPIDVTILTVRISHIEPQFGEAMHNNMNQIRNF